MDRYRLIAGVTITVVLITLLVYGLIQWRREPPRAGQKSPLDEVSYCSVEEVRPCIVSFSLDSDGNMLVNLLSSEVSFPVFYLKIVHKDGESLYECQKVAKFSDHVYCIGEIMPVGELLQFLLISKSDGSLLAEGKFAIIGLALPTPEGQLTVSVSPVTSVSPTQETPLATATVTATPPGPKSTPSPSYPNPSPSYP
ncbi:MAG TPA: hypothetical protein VJM08_01140 [Anaerolineales bacterium]|nr:hypothetical protein [Anaerolineales bacterium]